jgi:hypothetical protein
MRSRLLFDCPAKIDSLISFTCYRKIENKKEKQLLSLKIMYHS